MSAMMTVMMILPAAVMLIVFVILKTVGGWRYRGYMQLPVADLEVAVDDGGEDEAESARDTRLVIPAQCEATIASPAAAATTMAAAVQRDAVTSTPISTTREVSGYHSGKSLSSCECQFYEELNKKLQTEMKIERAMKELEVNDIINQLETVIVYQENVIVWQDNEIERLNTR